MIEVVKVLSVKEKCEIMCHIERKVKSISGIADSTEEEKVYEDVYNMAMRESGAFGLEYARPEFLYAIHEAIDTYALPAWLKNNEQSRKEYA